MNEQVFEILPVLQTDRLQLVRHELGHAADMYQLRIDKDVVKFLDSQRTLLTSRLKSMKI